MILLLFALATVAVAQKATVCPDAALLSPCTCELDSWAGAQLVCQGATALEISTALRQIPTDFYYSLTIESSNLGAIDSTVFGDNSFQEISIINGALTYVDGDTFVRSRDTLVTLKIMNNAKLTSFPFASISGHLALEYLYLSNNGLSEAVGIPPLPRLWTIHLDGNQLSEVPSLPYLPDLSWLNLQNNAISFVAPGAISQQPKLSSVYLNNNNITTILSGALVTSSSIRTIELIGNKIDTIEAGAFDVWPNTVVTFAQNSIKSIEQTVFASQLAIMYDGAGYFDFEGNPLACDCSIYWLINRQDLLMSVYNGVCTNGASLESLHSSDFLGC